MPPVTPARLRLKGPDGFLVMLTGTFGAGRSFILIDSPVTFYAPDDGR